MNYQLFETNIKKKWILKMNDFTSLEICNIFIEILQCTSDIVGSSFLLNQSKVEKVKNFKRDK